ncbi:DoxX family protein [Gammaproteobacteria bacterium AB-CW1]|uniref:DoxX family protein n=1 Tax=Natronospira elongata TaxID=3110268 RepID=A0AAP6JFW5_9GAMM|nr:DoxX family protein [Gammaproteobacteria bacterium AB-CW1]
MPILDILKEHARVRLQAWPLAVLRVATGIMFIIPGWRKVTGDFSAEGFVQASIAGFPGDDSREGASGAYAWFLENVVMAAPGLFSFMVAYGELFMGLALIFGVASRLAAAGGVVLLLSFHFAKGIDFWSAANYDAIWAIIFFVLAATAAGRVFGFDEYLYRRWPGGRWIW